MDFSYNKFVNDFDSDSEYDDFFPFEDDSLFDITELHQQLEDYLQLIDNKEVKKRLIEKAENGHEEEVLNFLWYYAGLNLETQESVQKFLSRCVDKVFWEIILKAADNIPTSIELEVWWNLS